MLIVLRTRSSKDDSFPCADFKMFSAASALCWAAASFSGSPAGVMTTVAFDGKLPGL